MRRGAVAAVALAAALVSARIAGSSLPPPKPTARCRGCNVVVVLVDTLRADRLGAYGYRRPTSPRLDAFAATATRFERARAQAACTFPSVNSFLTGRHVFRFLDAATRPAIPSAVPTLATLLGGRGYATAAVSASPIVRATPSVHNKVGGFDCGFGVFDESCLWREGGCVTARGGALLGALPRPFLLYLHYLDPHDPYTAPPRLRGSFAGRYAGDDAAIAAGDPNPAARRLLAGAPSPPSADLAFLSARYDEEVRAADAAIGDLLDALDARGLEASTVVVVAADHGESFLEGGVLKHCNGVHEAETRVPLMVRVPGAAPSVVPGWVQNVDVVPTVLDVLGFAASGLDGRSLRPQIAGEPAPPHLAYAVMGPRRALNDERHKLVWDAARRRVELFDLVADPGESRDLQASDRRTARRLLDLLRGWLARVEPGKDDAGRAREAAEVERELRALGYLG